MGIQCQNIVTIAWLVCIFMHYYIFKTVFQLTVSISYILGFIARLFPTAGHRWLFSWRHKLDVTNYLKYQSISTRCIKDGSIPYSRQSVLCGNKQLVAPAFPVTKEYTLGIFCFKITIFTEHIDYCYR